MALLEKYVIDGIRENEFTFKTEYFFEPYGVLKDTNPECTDWYNRLNQKFDRSWYSRCFCKSTNLASWKVKAFPIITPETINGSNWGGDWFHVDDTGPKELKVGWTIYEEIGITAMQAANDYAIARIKVCDNKLPSIRIIVK